MGNGAGTSFLTWFFCSVLNSSPIFRSRSIECFVGADRKDYNLERKILIVDGSNLLFRMFFGMPARIYNEQGIGIWGVLGFVGALLKMVRQTEPTHLAVFFDGENENERTLLDSEYKANRIDYSKVNDDENPYSQLPYIYQALSYLGIAYAETTDCEVDDWISSYTNLYGKENKIIVSSFDSDFFQLLNNNVSILRYRGEKSVIYTPVYLREKYGIEPSQYADFKSLTGDKADNIIGAEKIGIKTASALLQEFGTLDNIIRNADDIKKQSVRKSITKNSERLMRNLKLIKLDSIRPIPFELDELQFSYNGISTTEVLRAIGLKQ